MEVRPSGRVKLESEEQPQKAESPREMRPSGRAIEASAVQKRKAFSLMEVTSSGIVTCPFASGVYKHAGGQQE